jgi:hypothetical protein
LHEVLAFLYKVIVLANALHALALAPSAPLVT